MKGFLALLLTFCLMVTLCACGVEPSVEQPDVQPNEQQSGAQTDLGNETESGKGTETGTGTENQPATNNKHQNKDEEKLVNYSHPTTDKTEYGAIIACFGDSITEGMGMDRVDCYPSVLEANLKGQYKVLNGGVGGENSYTIAARANAVEFTVTKKMIFGKGESEIDSDWKIFSGIGGEEMRFRYGVMGRDLSIKKLTIDGAPYTLRYDKKDTEENSIYWLGRENTSEKVTISVGAKIKFDYSDIYEKRYCAIVLMGANDGAIPIETLIARYKAIEATAENFIAIIPHYGTDYTEQFKAAFGNRCVNLREYCKEQVWKDYPEFVKDKSDEVCIKEKILPRTFTYERRKGDCHLNKAGYKVLGDLVYKKGVELGYWK